MAPSFHSRGVAALGKAMRPFRPVARMKRRSDRGTWWKSSVVSMAFLAGKRRNASTAGSRPWSSAVAARAAASTRVCCGLSSAHINGCMDAPVWVCVYALQTGPLEMRAYDANPDGECRCSSSRGSSIRACQCHPIAG